MTYRFRSLFICSIVGGLSSVGLLGSVINGCGGDDSTAAPGPDAATEAALTDVPLVQPDSTLDGTGAIPTPQNWAPTAIMMNLRPQPSFMFGPPDAGAPSDPGFTIPFVQVTNNKPVSAMGAPKRFPDAFSPGHIPGLGCVSFKFTSTDPRAPTGPGMTDGDMGNVTLTGYSGGFIINPATGPTDASVASPITCHRNEFFPGMDAGLFGYGCDGPAGPVTGFMKPADTITASAEGGADLNGWTSSAHPSPNDDIVITNDLWNTPASAIDGSADLVINYTCGGGGPCGMTSVVAVIIQTSDGTVHTDAGPPPGFPFNFPDPKTEFGLVECQDFLSFNTNSFTVPKSILAEIPGSWTDSRIVVGTLAAKGGEVQSQPTTLAVGTSRFGITHR